MKQLPPPEKRGFLFVLWEFHYVWLSLLTTALIVFAFTVAISKNQEAVTKHIEQHIDQTIADTVRRALTAPPNPRTTKLYQQVQQICKATPGCTP